MKKTMKTATKTQTMTTTFTKVFVITAIALGILAVANAIFIPPANSPCITSGGTFGDLNYDGLIDFQDEEMILDMIANRIPPDVCADFDNDTIISPGDLPTFRSLMNDQGCVDTDGGANFHQVGTVTINGQFHGTDQCNQHNAYDLLDEHICQENKPITITRYCGGGCQDGICNTVYSNKTQTCTETDSGIDIFNAGTLSIDGNIREVDQCWGSPSFAIYDPVDEGPYLREHYCMPYEDQSSAGVYSYIELFECPNGCVNGACINLNPGDTRIYTCTEKPGGISTVWNSVDSYTQTWDGEKWQPADDPYTDYSTKTGPKSRKSCQYKCAAGREWNGNTCYSDLVITNISANTPAGLKAPSSDQDMLYFSLTADSEEHRIIYSLFFELRYSGGFQVNSCKLQDMDTDHLYNGSVEPSPSPYPSIMSYIRFTWFPSRDFDIQSFEIKNLKLICDTTGTQINATVLPKIILVHSTGPHDPNTPFSPIEGGTIAY